MQFYKKSKPKVFCIGLNKTGTTSLGTFLEKVNFEVDKQRLGEALLPQYLERDFDTVINHCKQSKAQVFQDVPFSLPYTYAHLDNAFPSSKFVLTIRNSDEQWYESILKFHSNMFNKGNKPTYESLLNSNYIYKGWVWDLMHDVFIKSGKDMYNKTDFTEVYEAHLTNVKHYFRHKPNKLIIINLAIQQDFIKLCEFLNINTNLTEFPRITSQDLESQNFNSKFLRK